MVIKIKLFVLLCCVGVNNTYAYDWKSISDSIARVQYSLTSNSLERDNIDENQCLREREMFTHLIQPYLTEGKVIFLIDRLRMVAPDSHEILEMWEKGRRDETYSLYHFRYGWPDEESISHTDIHLGSEVYDACEAWDFTGLTLPTNYEPSNHLEYNDIVTRISLLPDNQYRIDCKMFPNILIDAHVMDVIQERTIY